MESNIATSTITINASKAKVWDALVNPITIKKYMFGTDVVSDFREGSDIRWKGQWKGTSYEDKGKVVTVDAGKTLRYTHFSPLTGEADKAENYHTVTIGLTSKGTDTNVTLTQDNNKTPDAKEHSEKNWKQMLEGLKSVVESES